MTVFGKTFDSKKEAERYLYLKSEERQGHISDLNCQVPFVLIPAQMFGKWKETKYIADFTYMKDDELVVEDVKGYKKGSAYQIFVIKKKLMLKEYGIVVHEI